MGESRAMPLSDGLNSHTLFLLSCDLTQLPRLALILSVTQAALEVVLPHSPK